MDGKALQENKFHYLTGNRILMKDILCLLDYIRGIAAIKLKVDIDTLDYYDAYRTESEVKEEDFISLGKLIWQLSTVKNCRAITTELRNVLPDKMSNCLPTKRQLNKLRLVIDIFKIGGDRGPIWRFK